MDAMRAAVIIDDLGEEVGRGVEAGLDRTPWANKCKLGYRDVFPHSETGVHPAYQSKPEAQRFLASDIQS